MFQYRAAPYLRRLAEGVIVSHTLKLYGIGESAMEAQLRDRMNTMSNPTLAPYAKLGECELRITAKAADEGQAEALLAPVVAEMVEKFGAKVYGVDVSCLEEVVLSKLQTAGKTLGVAESCSGGLIAKRITDRPGASSAFVGGIVSYSSEVKHRLLGVPLALLEEWGAVSAPVAKAMAEGARQVLGCDIALSTTGVAGPDRDDRGNEVGTVFVAIATAQGTHVEEMHLGGHRDRIRTLAAHRALDCARRHLDDLPMSDEG